MRSQTLNLPAIAGGRPLFDELLPIASPEGLDCGNFLEDVRSILSGHRLTNGARVREFEEAVAMYLGVPHCVAVSNCTSGLILVMQALGLAGEVILPSFTFYATAHSVVWNGLTPVFADCDPRTFCLDAEAVLAQSSSRTAAVLAVHMFGNPAPVDQLEEVSNKLGVPLIYDAAHAFGSRTQGRRIGSFGVAEVFSFSPTKLLVAGEGGLISTQDASLAELLRAARNYGDGGGYDPRLLGLNARMSELHAALALRGMEKIDCRVLRRNEIRMRYEHKLASVPGIRFQHIPSGSYSACKDFSILVDPEAFGNSRDWLAVALERENIETRRYFWPPVHRQALYRHIWDGRALPATDFVSDHILGLPIYSNLTDEDVDKVSEAILRAYDFGVLNT